MLRLARALIILVLTSGIFAPAAYAAQQDNVDYVVNRIGKVLEDSLERKSWRNSYQLAERNIEDLKNTLRQGGQVSSNPAAIRMPGFSRVCVLAHICFICAEWAASSAACAVFSASSACRSTARA